MHVYMGLWRVGNGDMLWEVYFLLVERIELDRK